MTRQTAQSTMSSGILMRLPFPISRARDNTALRGGATVKHSIPQAHRYTRREFGRMALGAVPAAVGMVSAWPVLHAAAIDSRLRGVQIGAITYSFRAIPDAH